jgi:hypothetical protein
MSHEICLMPGSKTKFDVGRMVGLSEEKAGEFGLGNPDSVANSSHYYLVPRLCAIGDDAFDS